MKSARSSFCAGALALVAALSSSVAHATHNGVAIETVGNYSNCPGFGQITGANTSGSNFYNTLRANNPYGFTNSGFAWWQDNNVFDLDLFDSDLKSFADDNLEFDEPGLAISFFHGHGISFNQGTLQPCIVTGCPNNCLCNQVSPPPGATETACVWSPGSAVTLNGYGICRWNIPTQVPVIKTCSNQDQYGGQVPLSGGQVVFGENGTVGNWRGAQTNGNAALVVTHASFNMWLPFASEWFPMFGGTQLIAGIAESWDDVHGSAPSFGTAAAYGYYQNHLGSIKDEYINNISMVTDGGGCPQSAGGFSFPGGFNGCGCHAIMTMSSSPSGGQGLIGESWANLQFETLATNGNSYYYWYIGCNYNPNNTWYCNGSPC